jgi:hypothetical protein
MQLPRAVKKVNCLEEAADISRLAAALRTNINIHSDVILVFKLEV